MMETNFKLCWEQFQNNLSSGFSKLQQKQEFVDVTLATGGYFVKAHQNILAVVSPYLKELLKSTPCQHPVIFLGPISHKVLCFILEYIYTGEVNVPSPELPAFVEAAKLLHIAGIKDMHMTGNEHMHLTGIKDMQTPQVQPQMNVNNLCVDDVEIEKFSAEKAEAITPDNQNVELDVNTEVMENHVENISTNPNRFGSTENLDPSLTLPNSISYSNTLESSENPAPAPIDQTESNHGESDMMDFENLIILQNIPKCSKENTLTYQDKLTGTHDEKDCVAENLAENVEYESNSEIGKQLNIPTVGLDSDCNGSSKILKQSDSSKDVTAMPVYTTSNRGSVQMVLNRFIYYLHHTSNKKRRWRCIWYRKNRCTAYIDTKGDIVVGRRNLHNHPFQDNEILKLGRTKQFYTSISEVKNRCCHHKTNGNNSKTNETTSKNPEQEIPYKISIVFDQPLPTNTPLNE